MSHRSSVNVVTVIEAIPILLAIKKLWFFFKLQLCSVALLVDTKTESENKMVLQDTFGSTPHCFDSTKYPIIPSLVVKMAEMKHNGRGPPHSKTSSCPRCRNVDQLAGGLTVYTYLHLRLHLRSYSCSNESTAYTRLRLRL